MEHDDHLYPVHHRRGNAAHAGDDCFVDDRRDLRCAEGTCTNPTNAITYPFTVPAEAVAPAAVKFFNAAADTGMGKFTLTPTVGVSVPANTYAGTYKSTVTLASVSGP